MKKIILALLVLFWPVASFAATQIIVLNVSDAGSNRISYNYLCWLNSPNPLPNPNFVSAWKALGSSTGPSSPQVSALQNGTVVEVPATYTASAATPLATVESDIISDCASRQTYLNNIPGQGIYYGQTYNGASWSLQ